MDKYTWADKQSETAFPIAKAGYPFIFAAAFTTAVLAVLGFKFFAFLAIIITFFICFFFRDPDRVTPDVEGVITSPADGTIIFAKQIKDSPFYSGPCLKISIFMSVFNVHVNRIPYDGKIAKIAYNPGEFFPANLLRLR